MNALRVASIVLAVAAVSALATGTLGFTSATAERSVSVNVVDSEDAYVGVTACAPTHGNGNQSGNASGKGLGHAEVYVTVTNQYSTAVTVEELETASGVREPEKGEKIPTGESEKFALDFETDEVTIDVAGDGFDATVTADVEQAERHNCNPSEE